MSVTQISRIQHRRGLEENVPQLASAELGWSVDSQKLYIGNGTLEEGAPQTGITEIISKPSLEYILNGISGGTGGGNYTNVNVVASTTTTVLSWSPGTIPSVTLNYAMAANTGSVYDIRTGSMKISYYGSTATWEDDFTETADLGIELSASSTGSALTVTATSTNSNNAYMMYLTPGPDFGSNITI